jgi:hypothetical protein
MVALDILACVNGQEKGLPLGHPNNTLSVGPITYYVSRKCKHILACQHASEVDASSSSQQVEPQPAI